MIIATVTISTMTGNHDFPVEVIDAFKTSDGRRIAVVKALPVNGKEIEPFTKISHGGPYQSSTENIGVEYLKNVAVAVELPVALTVDQETLS